MRMSGVDEGTSWDLDKEHREACDVSPKAIAQNHSTIERLRAYRQAADTATKALIPFKEVQAVAVFGSVVLPLWKEDPRSEIDRRIGIEPWHEDPRIDLAVWLDRFNQLSAMRVAINRALMLNRDPGTKVEMSEIAVNLLEHGTDRHVGNLCEFKACPANKPACQVPGCGAVGHLRQFRDYRFDHNVLEPDRSVRLFDRATNRFERASRLPEPEGIDASIAE